MRGLRWGCVRFSRLTAAAAVAAAIAATLSSFAAVSGIDVSQWQGTVDWPQVASAGYRFAYIKATEGTDFTDPQFLANNQGARAGRLTVGAYHFARPSGSTRAAQHADAVLEAENFLRIAQPQPHDLAPVIDVESSGGLSTPALEQWVGDWLTTVEASLGVKPVVYTYPSFWDAHLGQSFALAGYKLWIASYGTDQATVPAGNWAGHGYADWQFSDCLTVPGIPNHCVDGDTFPDSSLDQQLVSAYTPPQPPDATPSLLTTPMIVGIPAEHQALIVLALDAPANDPQTGYSWQLCKRDVCTDVAATKDYQVRPQDAGGVLRVRMATHDMNGQPQTLYSAPTPLIADTTAPTVPALRRLQGLLVRDWVQPTYKAYDNGTGVGGYQLRFRRQLNGGAVSGYVTETPGMLRLQGLRPGYRYCLSARALDQAGNRSSWSPERCTTVAFDDTQLHLRGRWQHTPGGRYHGTLVRGRRPASASLRLKSVRYAALLVRSCKACGSADVFFRNRRIKRITLHGRPAEREIPLLNLAHGESGKLIVKVRRGVALIDGLAAVR